MSGREIGVPPGVTEYWEIVERKIFADGTISDFPPRRVGDIDAIGIEKDVTDERELVVLYRKVVVDASPWQQMQPGGPDVPWSQRLAVDRDQEKTYLVPVDQISTDFCKRTTCGHHHTAHDEKDDQGGTTDDPHSGMCAKCGNADQCRSFVGRPRENLAADYAVAALRASRPRVGGA